MNIQTSLFNSSKFLEEKRKFDISDPAWDNGKAFPEFLEEIDLLEWCEIPLRKIYQITFNKKLCDYSICAAALVQDSPLAAYKWEDLKLLGLAKSMNTVAIASQSSIPESTTTEISNPLLLKEDGDLNPEQSTLSPHHPPASPSQYKENDKQQPTNETASLLCSESSKITHLDTSALKTLKDCLIAPTHQEAIAHISSTSLKSYPEAGILQNGYVFRADTLQPPLIEEDYCWLPAPTAMSTKSSRPPGLSKLENFLKENELIKKGEVLNPVILCQWFGIPTTWLDPLEYQTATQLLENSVAQQEIYSILELQRSPSKESNTSIQSLAPDKSCPQCGAWLNSPYLNCNKCGWIHENFLEETPKTKKRSPAKKRRNKKGCLYRYLENKKLKDGQIASYPRITSNFRDSENPHHWRWGYNWDEKIDGVWKGRSIGSIPPGVIGFIQDMRSRNIPIEEIISFIHKAKRKK